MWEKVLVTVWVLIIMAIGSTAIVASSVQPAKSWPESGQEVSRAGGGQAAAKSWPQSGQVVVSGQLTVAEFKGDALGVTTLEEFKARHGQERKIGPHCSDEYPQAKMVLGADATWTRAGLVNCRATFLGAEVIPDKNFQVRYWTVAGVRTTMHLYEFVDGRLFRITMSVAHAGYGAVREQLVEKYDAPGTTVKTTAQNVYGARYVGEDATWTVGGTLITLREYGEGLETWLTYEHQELAEVAKARAPRARPDL